MGFEWAYQNGTPPWDIGRAQPAIVRLAAAGAISGAVIDIGCGTGENALYLASLGLDAGGLDAAPTAIARARAKAVERGLTAGFTLGDALDLTALGRTFDTAIDCGFFHVLSDGERVEFARGLHATLRPGGRYFMLCFSDLQPGSAGPRRVSQAEIRATFADGWRIDSIEAEHFAVLDAAIAGPAPLAWLASLTRLGGAESEAPPPAEFEGAPEPPARVLLADATI
jgi:cyclopropane fatty-acyl-phospholipid synthase-like methyltransferase